MHHLYNQVKQATMISTNINHPSNQQSVQTVSMNIVNNSSTVNVSRYVDFSNSSQTDDDELSKLFEQFEKYEKIGKEMGFRHVESGALVRSSYHAEKHIL